MYATCHWQVHQQIDCQPLVAASDSETNDVADSSDVLQYVTDSSTQLPTDDTASTDVPMSSSSNYKVFVNGNPGEYVEDEC